MAETKLPMAISVVIPTRNRADRLRQAIDSARRQTLSPLEIIVVDDASSDETPHLLASIDDTRLRVIRVERQRGASHARNQGIGAARGSLLALLDDDDRWLPEKLSIQSAALAAAPEQVGLICCAYHVVSDRGGRVVKTWQPPDKVMDVRYFLRTTGFMTTVPLIRASCLAAVGGFDEHLAGGQDLDLWIRIAERFQVAAVPEVLAEHRIHGDQITTNLPLKARASAQILRKHRERLAAYPELLARHLERAALLHCAAGDSDTGRAYLAEVIALTPAPDAPRAHLAHSLRDPAAHAALLRAHGFRRVDGMTLFY